LNCLQVPKQVGFTRGVLGALWPRPRA